MPQQSVQTTFHSTETNSVRFCRFNGAERGGTLCAVLHRTISVTELFKSSLEQYARKVAQMLHYATFNIGPIQRKLKGVTPCSEMVRESSSLILEYGGFLKRQLKMAVRRSVFERTLYRKVVVKM